jgi:hypothetical protein
LFFQGQLLFFLDVCVQIVAHHNVILKPTHANIQGNMVFVIEAKRTHIALRQLRSVLDCTDVETEIATDTHTANAGSYSRDLSKDSVDKQLIQCELHLKSLSSSLSEYLQMVTAAICCLRTLKRESGERTENTAATNVEQNEWFSEWAIHFLSMKSLSDMLIFLSKSKHGLAQSVQQAASSTCIKEEQEVRLEQLRSVNLKQVLIEMGHTDCDDGGHIIHKSCGYDKCDIRHKQNRGADEGGSVHAYCPRCKIVFGL